MQVTREATEVVLPSQASVAVAFSGFSRSREQWRLGAAGSRDWAGLLVTSRTGSRMGE